MKVIKELRQRAQLTQGQLANAVGVSRQAVASWEAGVWPSAELVPRIAEALRCEIGELYGFCPAEAEHGAEEPGPTE